jgi:cytochrome P450
MRTIAPLRDFDDSSYNPSFNDEAMFGDAIDPYPRMREFAARGTVQEGETRKDLGGLPHDMTLGDERTFMVFGYDEIRSVLNSPALFSNSAYRAGLGHTFGQSITTMDAPEHTRYRSLFQKAFLPHRVAEWADEFIDPVIHGLIDEFQPRERAELMAQFVCHYPFEIIYRQLHLPPGEGKIFHKLAVAMTFHMVDLPHAHEASEKLGTYFQAIVEQRREEPGTDLVSILATTEVNGEYLPDDVLISFLRQLINAAGDTTYRSTGNLLVALLAERPDQFESVKADRSLIPKAIEETLRWEGPVNQAFRTAVEDVELAGVHIPAGSFVQVLTGVANRDPKIFPDPDRFDLTRENIRSRHLAFSQGPHICVGQHLARLEMTRALNILLDRLPNLRLDADHPRSEIRGFTMRVPKQIHVRFD